jgi:ABC-2 type transport system ATP-binding protein
MALLRARELTKTYGSLRALDRVSFEIDEGITGLLGSNGAGKSTSLKLFLGLIEPDGGSAEVLGEDPRRSPEYRTRVGYAPEHDCLPRNVSAAEFLAYMARISGLPATAARLRASDVLRHVGLFEERYRSMGTYSTGMKQRVKLAQALVHDPLVAFLDEPTAGLDPLGRREMLELIRRVGGEFGISIVISTHLMGDVERACDSVVVLDAGRLLRTGRVSGFTEETETLEIELVEGADQVAAELRRRGLAPRLDGRRLLLEDVSGQEYDVVRDTVVDVGALLYRLAPARHSLADVFAGEATGEDSPDPARETSG